VYPWVPMEGISDGEGWMAVESGGVRRCGVECNNKGR
jgi:hypothetical protein